MILMMIIHIRLLCLYVSYTFGKTNKAYILSYNYDRRTTEKKYTLIITRNKDNNDNSKYENIYVILMIRIVFLTRKSERIFLSWWFQTIGDRVLVFSNPDERPGGGAPGSSGVLGN